MKKLRVGLSGLLLFWLVSVGGYSEVLLTDEEYSQVVSLLEESKEEWVMQRQTLEKLTESMTSIEKRAKSLEMTADSLVEKSEKQSSSLKRAAEELERVREKQLQHSAYLEKLKRELRIVEISGVTAVLALLVLYGLGVLR